MYGLCFPPVQTTSTSSLFNWRNSGLEKSHSLSCYVSAGSNRCFVALLSAESYRSPLFQYNSVRQKLGPTCKIWLFQIVVSVKNQCNSQKASIESSQISTYLNVNRKWGSQGSPVLLQLLSRLKRCVTLRKSLAEWSLLNPADKGFTADPEVKHGPTTACSMEINKPHCFRGKKAWQAIKCCQVNNPVSWSQLIGKKFPFVFFFFLLHTGCFIKSL